MDDLAPSTPERLTAVLHHAADDHPAENLQTCSHRVALGLSCTLCDFLDVSRPFDDSWFDELFRSSHGPLSTLENQLRSRARFIETKAHYSQVSSWLDVSSLFANPNYDALLDDVQRCCEASTKFICTERKYESRFLFGEWCDRLSLDLRTLLSSPIPAHIKTTAFELHKDIYTICDGVARQIHKELGPDTDEALRRWLIVSWVVFTASISGRDITVKTQTLKYERQRKDLDFTNHDIFSLSMKYHSELRDVVGASPLDSYQSALQDPDHSIFRMARWDPIPTSLNGSSGSNVWRSASTTDRSFRSAYSNSSAWASARSHVHFSGRTKPMQLVLSRHQTLFEERGLLSGDTAEIDWSGRGRHVEFLRGEPVPLENLGHLGASHMATVEKVLCRRVILARKAMTLQRRFTMADAITEVEHLQKLRHAHVVQLIGTYLQGRNFSVLLYPAANYDLKTYLQVLEDERDVLQPNCNQGGSLYTAFACISVAVSYIHDSCLKHMDIKPQNILLQIDSTVRSGSRWYLADFGISRSFSPQDHSQTNDLRQFTPKFAAPEVHGDGGKGRAADIFSLGCVFLHILTAIYGISIEAMEDFIFTSDDDQTYQGNLLRTVSWLQHLYRLSPFFLPYLDDNDGATKLLMVIIQLMLERNPERRPPANYLTFVIGEFSCCAGDPAGYVDHAEAEERGQWPTYSEWPIHSEYLNPLLRWFDRETLMRIHECALAVTETTRQEPYEYFASAVDIVPLRGPLETGWTTGVPVHYDSDTVKLWHTVHDAFSFASSKSRLVTPERARNFMRDALQGKLGANREVLVRYARLLPLNYRIEFCEEAVTPCIFGTDPDGYVISRRVCPTHASKLPGNLVAAMTAWSEARGAERATVDPDLADKILDEQFSRSRF